LAKIASLALLSVMAAVLIVGVAFYWRLSRGPVSLNFMTDTIQAEINQNMHGLQVKIGGAVIEREAGSGIPHFRLRDIVLSDAQGNLIARAPRAAIGVDERGLLGGSIIPKSLELIGPRILIKRTLEGSIQLGFGSAAAGENEAVIVDNGAGAKTNQETDHNIEPEIAGTSLLDVLGGGKDDQTPALSSIEDVRVSNASIRLFDEANDAMWLAPKAELAFRRMPYGFVVASNAAVSNGAEAGTFHVEMSASYRRDSRSFSISARFYDLIPANIADEIFALSQLARVKVPLSGQAEIELTGDGKITKASAEFAAAAGEVGFPDYLAQPIIVDEGSLRADYNPATGGVIITDSALLVGGSRAELTGSVAPVRQPDGRLTALDIRLQAHNVSIDAQGTVVSPVAVDRIDFAGTAAIEEARLDIGDLVIMSGDTGVRMRGAITGGGESPGLMMSGRIRGLSSTLLKRLWPPIVAPKTRAWVNQYIRGGRIATGEFQVNLPVDAMARAQRNKRLPDNAIKLHFNLEGVTSSYFKNLPPLENAMGELTLSGNDFALKVASATVTLPSGKSIALSQGSMEVDDVLGAETQSVIAFDTRSSVQALIEYLNLPDVGMLGDTGIDVTKLGGDATMNVTLKMPLIKNIPRERLSVAASAHLLGASLRGALRNIDITDGDLALTLAGGKISAEGPAKLNGVDAHIAWSKEPGAGGKQSATIEANLDDKERKAIGVDLYGYLSGPIALKAAIADLGDETGPVAVSANLGKATMQIPAINWYRPATPKTRATFTYFAKGEGGRRVSDLEIAGPDVSIKGDIKLRADGFSEATLNEVRLSDENSFAMTIKRADEGTLVNISGRSFDARPLIKSMFGAAKDGGDGAAKVPLTIETNIDRVYVHRGEIITGVTGNVFTLGDRVQQAVLQGTFLSGQPIVMRVEPVGNGRKLRIAGRDGGAALRAANLYSKVAGGEIDFSALLANDANSSVREGKLVLRNFEVRNEAALAELDQRGKPKKSGPRKGGIIFDKLTLPFTTDAKFVRIGDSLIRGPDLGASAEGLIRKADGAIDITGTIIPAYALNSAIGSVPLFGQILTGGRGQGIFGLTFALGGSMAAPRFQVNPVSAIAPGILRKFFEYGGTGAPPPQKEAGSKG